MSSAGGTAVAPMIGPFERTAPAGARTRVAVIATITDFGGIEQVLLSQLQHHDDSVELVPVLFTRRDATPHSFFDRLERIGVSHVTYVNDRRRRYVNFVRNVGEALWYLRRGRFDVLHTHGYRANALGLLASTCFGTPVVSTCHGYTTIDRALRTYRSLDVMALRRFTRVIAVSSQMQEDLVADGIERSKIDVIPNAVATPSIQAVQAARVDTRRRLGLADGDFLFGYVGRLSEEKGVDDFVRAASALAAGNRAARFLMIGDGDRRQPLVEAARQSGLAGRIHFAGFQSDTSQWYPAMDAFVLPSHTEGTPMALLEAMAHALPPIATAVGGVPAIVTHERNGLLVPAGDGTALLRAMRRVSSDSGLRRTMSSEAAATVRANYGIESWVERTNAVYAAAAARRRRKSA